MKTSIKVFVAVMLSGGVAQAKSPQAGERVYPGEWNPRDIIEVHLDRTEIPERFEASLTVPLIKDGEMVKEDENLDDRFTADHLISSELTVPFKVSSFVSASDGQIDWDAYFDEMDTMLFRMRLDGSEATDSSRQSVLNQPNCGGYPVGSRISITECWLGGQLTTNYECQTVGGQNNWYITGQNHIPNAPYCRPSY